MKIHGIEHLTSEQLSADLQRGGRFKIYPYCISVLVMSFKRHSDIHFVPAGTSQTGKIAAYSVLTLLLGWWGIPWGPIWTVSTLVSNLGGGLDVTDQVMASLRTPAAIPQAPSSQSPFA